MNKWRPKDWDECGGNWCRNAYNERKWTEYGEAYEAGADAMLEALRGRGLPTDGTFLGAPVEHGILVVIPDDKE